MSEFLFLVTTVQFLKGNDRYAARWLKFIEIMNKIASDLIQLALDRYCDKNDMERKTQWSLLSVLILLWPGGQGFVPQAANLRPAVSTAALTSDS